MSDLWRDLRYGLRMLATSPGFTIVALISLSLGICIATSAFSEMNGLILRNVPGVQSPSDLVMVDAPASYPTSDITAYVAPAAFSVSTGGQPQRIWGNLVTAAYFATLGVRPLLGRTFTDEEDQPQRHRKIPPRRWPSLYPDRHRPQGFPRRVSHGLHRRPLASRLSLRQPRSRTRQ